MKTLLEFLHWWWSRRRLRRHRKWLRDNRVIYSLPERDPRMWSDEYMKGFGSGKS